MPAEHALHTPILPDLATSRFGDVRPHSAVCALFVTEAQFRKLALAVPGAEEREHMGHPDFRVHGRIFATLQPAKKQAMVKISLEQQAHLVDAEPEAFLLLGGWSKSGATGVNLPKAKAALVRDLLAEAAALAAAKKKAR